MTSRDLRGIVARFLGVLAMMVWWSSCFTGLELGGPPTRLVFRATSGGAARQPLAAVEVEIQDASGNLVGTANDEVTIALATNPGRLVLHASGKADNDRIVEVVDHLVPEVRTPVLSGNEGTTEILAMVYDSATGTVLAVDLDNALSSIDVATGVLTKIGDVATNLKGIAFETESGRLIGVAAVNDTIVEINPTTGASMSLGRVTIVADSVDGFTGLAEDPVSGTMYAVVRLRDNPNRKTRNLATLDVAALTITNVATLSETGVAGITFLGDGTLLAVTGDGSDNPETLWSVNKSSGMMTAIVVMGNGGDGESIAAVPALLEGTLTRPAVNGVAVFSDLTINAAADGYTFVATAPGLGDGNSATFNIVP